MISSALPSDQIPNAGVMGNAEIRSRNKSRRVMVYGEGPDFSKAFTMRVSAGSFLPPDSAEAARAFPVLGSKAKQELFGAENPLGAVIQVGGMRFRIIGVMAPKGQILGFDLDDTVYIPTARALELFNREGVMEAHVVYRPGTPVESVMENIKRILLARHGREDFTVTPQQQMLSTLSTVLAEHRWWAGRLRRGGSDPGTSQAQGSVARSAAEAGFVESHLYWVEPSLHKPRNLIPARARPIRDLEAMRAREWGASVTRTTAVRLGLAPVLYPALLLVARA